MRGRTIAGLEGKMFALDMDQHAFEEWARTASYEDIQAYRITGGSFVLTKEVIMASAAFKNYRPIMQELERQGWSLEQTANGHWRCVPPDKTKSIVHFAASDEPRALDNAVAELRSSGFVWPAPSKAEQRADRGSGVRQTEKAPLTQKLDLSGVMERAGFVETPAASGATVPAPPPSHEALSSNPNETEEERMDRIYKELKEAKAYVALTAEARDDAWRVMKEAQEAYDKAAAEHSGATATFEGKKDALNRALAA